MRAALPVFVLILLLAGGAVAAWMYFDQRQGEEKRTQEEKEASATEKKEADVERFFAQEPIAVTESQLVKLYRTNEVAARDQYLGRPLKIDGHVDRIAVEKNDGKEFPVLYFSEGGACAFNWGTPQPELANLKHGQRVVVLGQPRGAKPGVEHLTTHCSIVSYIE